MKRLLALAAIAVVAAACTAAGGRAGSSPTATPPTGATPEPPTGPPPISHPAGATEVVVRIGYDGGFVAPGFFLTWLPSVTVYGDGTVITQGPVAEIYPGPALPNLRVSRVSEAGLQEILAAAAGAGLLGADRHYGYDMIADAPTATFTVVANGATHETTAYALGIGDDRPEGMSAEDAAARKALTSFEAKLADLPSWLGSEVVAADRSYGFDAIRVFTTPGDATALDPGVEPSVVDWPLAEPLATAGIPLDGIGREGSRCLLLEGDDLATARPMLETATELTFVRSGGATYSLGLRPLLPDEAGCPTT
jgi:hypothetical protein